MNIEELNKKYGHLFNIIDYTKLKWYQKIIFNVKRFFRRYL